MSEKHWCHKCVCHVWSIPKIIGPERNVNLICNSSLYTHIPQKREKKMVTTNNSAKNHWTELYNLKELIQLNVSEVCRKLYWILSPNFYTIWLKLLVVTFHYNICFRTRLIHYNICFRTRLVMVRIHWNLKLKQNYWRSNLTDNQDRG